ncbi:hypothetical protein [Haloarcula amylolytica]|uniref:hypothetical protein n=1 Tax=Haloarcula amylolytica TaxID=396317 RepID=UPI003C74716A
MVEDDRKKTEWIEQIIEEIDQKLKEIREDDMYAYPDEKLLLESIIDDLEIASHDLAFRDSSCDDESDWIEIPDHAVERAQE